MIGVSAPDLQSSRQVGGLFIGSEAMVVVLKQVGTMHWLRKSLNMEVRTWASLSAHAQKACPGRLPGLRALRSLIHLSTLSAWPETVLGRAEVLSGQQCCRSCPATFYTASWLLWWLSSVRTSQLCTPWFKSKGAGTQIFYLTVDPGLLVEELPDSCVGHNVINTTANACCHRGSMLTEESFRVAVTSQLSEQNSPAGYSKSLWFRVWPV